MHIPDGLIGDNPFGEIAGHAHEHVEGAVEHAHEASAIINPNYQLLIYAIIAIILIAIVFYKYRQHHNEKNVVQIALFTVAVFIVQWIELPLPVAACVHISLITVLALYDLEMSMIIYTFVTILQALILGEGGVSTLGVNLLNLAIIAPLIAYTVFNYTKKFNKTIALFLSGFLTITLLGVIVGIEYAIAGTFPLSYGLTVITPVEAIVGILEGIVTVFVMNALHKVKPELAPIMNEN
ncbi:MAG: energy-coupling factor ABC transporter permease [Methanosphaera sp.]|nr:energy-coupling factor ABC transporter permease [Methanosphaera sp.]